MKKLIILILLLFVGAQIEANPWHNRTQHQKIKKMSRREVREAQIGRTLYERNPRTGKIEKNMRISWSTVKKPTTYNAFHNNKKSTRKPIFNVK